jgi:hypothetical protein
LSAAKARRLLMSVVFCESMVPTNESSTLFLDSFLSRTVPCASSVGPSGFPYISTSAFQAAWASCTFHTHRPTLSWC